MPVKSLIRARLLAALCVLICASGCAMIGESAFPAPNVTETTPVESTAPAENSASADRATPGLAASSRGVSALQGPAPSATLYPAVEAELQRARARASAGADANSPTPSTAAQHVVVWGDTLTGIAAKTGTSIAALLAINELANPDRLTIGQVIDLPPPPESFTPGNAILADGRLVRTGSADEFNIGAFVSAQPGMLDALNDIVITRRSDGSERRDVLSASQIVERVALEFSVDPRILLALLEHRAGLLSRNDTAQAESALPLLRVRGEERDESSGLYAQLSWMADRLNQGYYGWKFRNRRVLELGDGSRLLFHPELNAASVAVQYVMSQLSDATAWRFDVGIDGVSETYRRYFGDPFASVAQVLPEQLAQPALSLPFPPGQVWLFTGGFHGGWGNGSAWAAVDFAPPSEPGSQHFCYTSSYPVVAVADGKFARLAEGVIVLDLDGDGNEGTGWTILYLHIDAVDSLREGQMAQAGSVLGFASCRGGFSTATHLHIARRFNGEWIPADCAQCPAGMRIPPFVMSDWRVIGLANQQYQGYMVNQVNNRSAIAEQGRTSPINQISW